MVGAEQPSPRRTTSTHACCITSATTDYTHMENAASSTGDHVDLCLTSTTTNYTHGDRRFIHRRSCWPCITSATTDYIHMENAASLIGNHDGLWRMPLHQLAIMLTFLYLRRPPTTHAWRSPFIDQRSCWPNFDDHRLRVHGDHRFIDRRSCWPYITSATIDYTPMENAASSIGDHVDLLRTPLHQPAILLTLAFLRRPPTTLSWRSPFHLPGPSSKQYLPRTSTHSASKISAPKSTTQTSTQLQSHSLYSI